MSTGFPTGLGVGADVSRIFPRHVGSRIMLTNQGSLSYPCLIHLISSGDVVWRPAADVWDTEKEIVAHIDLPGVAREEITIDSEADQIVVHGDSKRREGFETASSRVRERNIGK